MQRIINHFTPLVTCAYKNVFALHCNIILVVHLEFYNFITNNMGKKEAGKKFRMNINKSSATKGKLHAYRNIFLIPFQFHGPWGCLLQSVSQWNTFKKVKHNKKPETAFNSPKGYRSKSPWQDNNVIAPVQSIAWEILVDNSIPIRLIQHCLLFHAVELIINSTALIQHHINSTVRMNLSYKYRINL